MGSTSLFCNDARDRPYSRSRTSIDMTYDRVRWHNVRWSSDVGSRTSTIAIPSTKYNFSVELYRFGGTKALY